MKSKSGNNHRHRENNHDHIEADTHYENEDEFLDELLLSDDQIPFPNNENWNHLGRTVRNAAEEKHSKSKNLRFLRFWAVAASLVLILGIAVLYLKEGDTRQLAHAPIRPAEELGIEEATEIDIVQIEALLIQTEMDVLSLDLLETEEDAYEGEEDDDIDIIELFSSYDIDPAQLFDEYIRAL